MFARIVLAIVPALWLAAAVVHADTLPLPQGLIDLRSEQGEELLRDGDALEAYVPLSGSFVTQETQAFCGVASMVTVLNAQVCSVLEKAGSPDWQCTAANDDLHPGTYMFYTRLLTDANTTVEHRWYRDERVHRVVRLRVTASPGSGYRTFSSTTISPERAGDWKIELRAPDGTLLREARFVVR